MSRAHFNDLMKQVSQCQICAPHLAQGCRPVLQVNPQATVLIIGQAPGLKVHKSGIPFDDASGERLRLWMGIDQYIFIKPKNWRLCQWGCVIQVEVKVGIYLLGKNARHNGTLRF